MIKEDFKALGDMSTYLFNEIEYWLNYDGKIAEEKKSEIGKISKGLIQTENNRTFAEAVISNKKSDIATVLIFNGNFDARLYALTVAYDYDKEVPMMLYFPITIKTVQDYIKFIQEVFSKLDQIYLECIDYEEEKQILKNIKSLLTEGLFPQKLQHYKIELNELFYGHKYKWKEELKRQFVQKQLKLIPDKKGNLRIG